MTVVHIPDAATTWPSGVPLLHRVRQMWPVVEVPDIADRVSDEFASKCPALSPGSSVALLVGSRGIARIREVTAAVAKEIRRRGCTPIIVPAMGSHGGASDSGQEGVLRELGISRHSTGAVVRSSLEVLQVGITHDGLRVLFDRIASECDYILPINRVKSHTDIIGDIESGLTKMLVVGAGNHEGAAEIHRRPMSEMSPLLREAAELIVSALPVLGGVALVESPDHELAFLEFVPTASLVETEAEVLVRARGLEARLPLSHLDVLVVGAMGKDISGTGMDPNVTGRYYTAASARDNALECERLVALRLTTQTGGNATGVGMADIVTSRLVGAADWAVTYTNEVTARMPQGARIPLVANTDQAAVSLALRTLSAVSPEAARMALIPNTQDLREFWVTEPMLGDPAFVKRVEQRGTAAPFAFDSRGRMLFPPILPGAD